MEVAAESRVIMGNPMTGRTEMTFSTSKICYTLPALHRGGKNGGCRTAYIGFPIKD